METKHNKGNPQVDKKESTNDVNNKYHWQMRAYLALTANNHLDETIIKVSNAIKKATK